MIELIKYFYRLFRVKYVLIKYCTESERYEYGAIITGILNSGISWEQKKRYIEMTYSKYIQNLSERRC